MPTCFGITTILDYSHSQLIPIKTGIAAIQNGTFKIIHVFDVEEYETAFHNLSNQVNEIETTNILYPFLAFELSKAEANLRRLRPFQRKTRSIEILGTAWKWLAGTPDHNDHEIITNKINEQLENNNKQIVINRVLNDRLNQITQITNTIIKTGKDNPEFKNQKITTLKYKIHAFKEELNNLIYAIDWAKTNTINSLILSEVEIKKITNILETEDILFINPEELLEFSKIKIATNNKNILYMINIPLIANKLCVPMLLKTVKVGDIINDIKFENIVRCNQQILGMKEPCETHNDKIICNRNNLVDLSDDKCITHLLKNQIPQCKIINSQHVPNHEELFTGTLLLNDFVGTIEIDMEKMDLKGTFLIQFENATIRVGDDTYISKTMTPVEATPPLLQLMAEKTKVDEVLSLQMLKEVNINNTRNLERLNGSHNISITANLTMSATLIVLLIVLLARFIIRRKSRQVTLKVTNEETAAPKEDPKPTTTQKRLYIATEDVRV